MKKMKAFLAAITLLLCVSNVYAEEGDYVASIGSTQYETLDEAIENALDGEEIVLLKDASTNGMYLNKSITINGNNNNVVFNTYGIALWDNANLTFKNVNIEMTGIGSTPYPEWSWMSICGRSSASLNLVNTTMVLDGTNTASGTHAIYFTGNNKLELTNSKLTIKNYKQDALEWNGGTSGYNVLLNNSTFESINNRSGITGTFNFKAIDSNVFVNDSIGNGSNGTNFEFYNSKVKFNNNRSHGLSTSNLIVDNSTIEANKNGGNGIHVNGLLNVTNNSTITILNNECAISSKWSKPGSLLLTSNNEHNIDSTTTLTIKNNYGSGINLVKGSLYIEDEANVTITDNTAYKLELGGGIYVASNTSAYLGNKVSIYNNHAITAGDDIYSLGSITFPSTQEDWNLDNGENFDFTAKNDNSKYSYNKVECEEKIDGWYDDSEENGRWLVHDEDETKLHFVEFEGNETSELLSIKAAHALYSKVIAKYIDTEGNILNDDIITRGKYKEEYKTNFIDIENYKLVEIKGNPTGTYGTTDIEVVYVYEFVGGMGGEIVDLPVINTDNNIPITGVNDNYITETIFAISIVSLFATCILRKKYN